MTAFTSAPRTFASSIANRSAASEPSEPSTPTTIVPIATLSVERPSAMRSVGLLRRAPCVGNAGYGSAGSYGGRAAAPVGRLVVMTSGALQMLTLAGLAASTGLLMALSGPPEEAAPPASTPPPRCRTCGRTDRWNCACRR